MRNPFAIHLNFDELLGTIPENPKILPSNIDMIYERCGKFLIGEWKRPNEKISIGQSILLNALATQDNFIVLIRYVSYFMIHFHAIPNYFLIFYY